MGQVGHVQKGLLSLRVQVLFEYLLYLMIGLISAQMDTWVFVQIPVEWVGQVGHD